LTPLLNLLQLNAHLLKHIIGHGVGLRQFCDLARAYHSYNGKYDKAELEEIYDRTGLKRWSKQLHAFLIDYIGVEPQELPSSEPAPHKACTLLEIVLEGGNFGKYGSRKAKPARTAIGRKLVTFTAFFSHLGFSLRYAPKEAFWTPVNLMIGNLR
ncbi:MAG: nucleotidyltransferase family protein, partial [Bacteroidales bacterium]|nr:nucleotidyltransferase family protein [Bacteroidales bacterium]